MHFAIAAEIKRGQKTRFVPWSLTELATVDLVQQRDPAVDFIGINDEFKS